MPHLVTITTQLPAPAANYMMEFVRVQAEQLKEKRPEV
jgi:hypothetical protein